MTHQYYHKEYLLYCLDTQTQTTHCRLTVYMKGTKVLTLGARAVAGAWCMASCLGHNNNYGHECRRPSYLSQASCVIVSRPVYSSAGLGYISPPRCAERAKHGRGIDIIDTYVSIISKVEVSQCSLCILAF